MSHYVIYSGPRNSSGDTTTDPSNATDGLAMAQTWIWMILAMVAIMLVLKFCCWCAEQNGNCGSTSERRLSSVAIIDAAVPESVTCPRCEGSDNCPSTSDEPPPYGSLALEFFEDPPPPYTSLSLQPLPPQEQEPHVSNRTEDCSRILHI